MKGPLLPVVCGAVPNLPLVVGYYLHKEGESMKAAFEAALDYMAGQASKRELEYSGAEFLSEEEEDS
jgi:hypothetical protein